MALPDPFVVISAAVALAIGQYTVLSTYLGRGFVRRYSDFQDAFSKWQHKETKRLWKHLAAKAKEKEPPEEIIRFVREWEAKNRAVKSLRDDYSELDFLTKVVLILSGVSVLAGAIGCFQQTAIVGTTGLASPASQSGVSWLDLSFWSFVFAALGTIYYLWKLHRLSSLVAMFEIDKSTEDIVQFLVREQERKATK